MDRKYYLFGKESNRPTPGAREPGRERAAHAPGRLQVGGRQPDARSGKLAGTPVLSAEFEVKGKATELPP